HRGPMHPDILSDGLALPPPMGHQDRLTPVAEASVISGVEDRFQWRLFCGCQPNPPHRFHLLSCNTVREGTSKKMQGHQPHVLDTIFRVVTSEVLKTRIVLIIREDFLGKLEILAQRYPQVFDHRVHLGYLDASSTSKAILGPFEPDNPFRSRLTAELAE